jgi:hypothetical protein
VKQTVPFVGSIVKGVEEDNGCMGENPGLYITDTFSSERGVASETTNESPSISEIPGSMQNGCPTHETTGGKLLNVGELLHETVALFKVAETNIL